MLSRCAVSIWEDEMKLSQLKIQEHQQLERDNVEFEIKFECNSLEYCGSSKQSNNINCNTEQSFFDD